MSYKSIGRQLQLAREQAGYSQEQLSAKIGCSQSTLSNYEKGRRRIYLAQLEKIAQLMGKPIEFFLHPLDNTAMLKNDSTKDMDLDKPNYPLENQMQTNGTTTPETVPWEKDHTKSFREQELLEKYRSLSDDGQKLVQSFVDWVNKREMTENG